MRAQLTRAHSLGFNVRRALHEAAKRVNNADALQFRQFGVLPESANYDAPVEIGVRDNGADVRET